MVLTVSRAAQRYNTCSTRGIMKYHEPEYLQYLKSPVPVYDYPINVQLKGYDFTVLEFSVKQIVKIASLLGVKVAECWATPHESAVVSTYKPQSTTVEETYKLNVYERNVQVTQLSGVTAPIFLEAIQAQLSPGVRLSVHKHDLEHEEIRYIPDLELEDLQKQLDEIKNPPASPHIKKPF